MRQLLAPTDLSARSERAVRRAARLVRQSGASWQVLHVVDSDQPAAAQEEAARLAEALLRQQAPTLAEAAGRQPEIAVRAGDPFAVIVQAADEADVDLVVMGAHRRQILRDVFVGTTIERVIRTGHRPVLMVNAEPERPYRRIAVAVDLSAASANALQVGRRLGLFDGAQVTVIHGFEAIAHGMMIYAGIEREKIEAHMEEESRAAQSNLLAFLAGLGLEDLPYEVRIEHGPAYASIANAVRKLDPDLLLIGTRGLTGAKRILLGSVADAVLRGIPCDILAVPPPPEAGATP